MNLFFLGLGLILAGGLAASRSLTVFRLLVAAGCLVGSVPAIAVLAGGAPVRVNTPVHVPGGPWVIGIDALSAWFLLVVFGVGAATALYGASYLGRRHDPVRASRAHLVLSFLLVSLALVVTAAAAIPFLMAWELMAICAYLLLIFENEQRRRPAGRAPVPDRHPHRHARAVRLVRALGQSGARPDLRRARGRRTGLAGQGAAVLALALFAFGLKAGLVPLHFWLPDAHAAAPSHVSALFSGVMIKTGIYGLLRVLLLLGGAPPGGDGSSSAWAWSRACSACSGRSRSTTSSACSRITASRTSASSCSASASGALGMTYHHPVVAVLGFAGAMLHTLNHALFKSLLFLGAGAVVHATGTRDIERLGGLAKRMPLTWAAFLVGSVAIVGLPPLNGFVSEWVTYQALLAGGMLEGPIRLQVLAVAGLALVGALALACFAKVCGIVFLGQPRMPEAWSATEAERGMLAAAVPAGAGLRLHRAGAGGRDRRVGPDRRGGAGPEGAGIGATPRHLSQRRRRRAGSPPACCCWRHSWVWRAPACARGGGRGSRPGAAATPTASRGCSTRPPRSRRR